MTELAEAMPAIRRAVDRFIGAAASIADADWAVAPPGGWSPAEITEHVAVANTNISKRLGHLGLLDRAVDVEDEDIPYLFYRGDEPPGVAAPTGTWTDRTAALTDFEAAAQPLVDRARFAGVDLRSVGAPHPVFGLLDGRQWLLFAAAHTLRHHAQLLPVTPQRG